MTLPILPTAIVGSYAMPGWLERLKTEYFARRISRHDLDEIHDAAVKAAIKDENPKVRTRAEIVLNEMVPVTQECSAENGRGADPKRLATTSLSSHRSALTVHFANFVFRDVNL